MLGGVSLAGGRGSVWAAVVGGLLLATLQQGLRLNGVDPVYFSIVTGACIVAGVVFDRGVQRIALSRILGRPPEEPPRPADRGGVPTGGGAHRCDGGRKPGGRMTTTSLPTTAPARTNPLARLGNRLLLDPTLGVFTLLVAVCVISAFVLPEFLSATNLTNLLGSSLTVMILAMGMTVVLVSGGIDLSVGAVMALCAGVTAKALLAGLPLIAAFGCALLVGVLVGVGNGLLVTRLKLPDFIATLAMLGFASGVLYIWTGGVPLIGYMLPEYYYVGGLTPLFGSVTVPMVTALVLALVLGGMLGSTRLGTHLFAVGSGPVAAMQSAVRVDRIRVFAYVVSGATAAIAGIILAGRNTNVPADLGNGFEIQAIAAAVIGGAALSGGRGRILGAVLGRSRSPPPSTSSTWRASLQLPAHRRRLHPPRRRPRQPRGRRRERGGPATPGRARGRRHRRIPDRAGIARPSRQHPREDGSGMTGTEVVGSRTASRRGLRRKWVLYPAVIGSALALASCTTVKKSEDTAGSSGGTAGSIVSSSASDAAIKEAWGGRR